MTWTYSSSVTFNDHASIIHFSSCAPKPTRAFTIVYASWILAGSRFEPVLYSDRYFAPTLARNRRLLPSGCSNVADRLADHFGANDSGSFSRVAETTPWPGFSVLPKSSISVSA